MEQLQTENNAAGGLSDLTDVLGAAVPPAPTFADGMTAEDDRRFLELTNDLTHNARLSGPQRPAQEVEHGTK